MLLPHSIEQLYLTPQAVKQPQYPPLHFFLIVRLHDKKVVSSTVILETQQLETYQVLLYQLSL